MATPENHQEDTEKKKPEDLIKFESFSNSLKLKSERFKRDGRIEELEVLAILHFVAGNMDEAKIYGSDQFKSVLRMLEVYKTVVKKKGEKISILAEHQKMLLRMKETILRQINTAKWDDKKSPSEILRDYKRNFKFAAKVLIDEIMVVLIKEFARALRVYKDTEKNLLNQLMVIRI